MAKKGSIAARVGWLRNEAERRLQAEAEAQTESAVLTIEDKRRFLARVVRACVATTPDDSDLWQSVKRTKDGIERRFPDKIKAIESDNDLAGDGSQAKANESLATELARIRNLPR